MRCALSARREPKDVKEELSEFALTRSDVGRNVFRLVIGLALLVYGAQQLVDSAITLARLWGWSELLMG